MLFAVTTDGEQLADIAAALITSTASSEMTLRAGQALELTDALWDLVPLVVAEGERYDARTPAQIADASLAGRRMTADARARVLALAQQTAATLRSLFDGADLDESALNPLTLTDLVADPFGAAMSMVDVPALAAQALPSLLPTGLRSTDDVLYFQANLRAEVAPARTPTLLRALFVTAVSTVEPLLTRMVHLLLQNAERDRYPTLTDPALDERARRLSYGNPNRWRDLLLGRFHVAHSAEVVDWDGLQTLWDVRNVLAHRGGIADVQYSQTSGVPIGSILPLDADRVRAAIDCISAARYGLVVAVWDHLEPGRGARLASESWVIAYDGLRAGQWRLAEGLSKIQLAFASTPEATAEAQVDVWLAVDRGLGADAIRTEVEAWDISSLPARFELAKLLLIHRDEAAFRLLRDLMTTGEIAATHLDAPLFDRVGGLDEIRDLSREPEDGV